MASSPLTGDAILIATGWGDKPYGESYVLGSPHLSLEAAQYLTKQMNEKQSDLLLIDTAMVGWPEKHLLPEWCSLLPTPRSNCRVRRGAHVFAPLRRREGERRILSSKWNWPARAL